MTFHLESEMQAPVRLWMEGQGLATKTEFSTPWGVCDLVGVSFYAPNVTKRLAHGQTRAIGSAATVAILHEIPDVEEQTSITLRGLSRRLENQVDPESLERELERLRRSRFVVSPRKNAFQRINGWLPLHCRIAAVELKLSRFTDALSQAASHLVFATESYVALPRDLALRVLHDYRASQLSVSGVGLIAVTADSCELLLPSAGVPSCVDQVLQHACVEHFWSGHIKGSSSLVAEQCAPAE